VNYASFLAEIWPEEVRRVDLSKCRVIKWIVAPFHGNLPNLSNDPHIYTYIYDILFSNLMKSYIFVAEIDGKSASKITGKKQVIDNIFYF